MGKQRYPAASELMITDYGGGNNERQSSNGFGN
jgi:hypothetical protein